MNTNKGSSQRKIRLVLKPVTEMINGIIHNAYFTDGLNNWTASQMVASSSYNGSAQVMYPLSTAPVFVSQNLTGLVDGKTYRFRYIINRGQNCKHFVSLGTQKSKTNIGSGFFEADLTYSIGNNNLKIGFESSDVQSYVYISQCEIFEVLHHELDVLEDFDVILTMSVAEIQDISKRNSVWSKTITIPGTKKNNLAFKNVFRTDAENSFRFDTPVTVLVFSDTEFFFSGNLTLNKVNINGEQVDYECNISSSLFDLYKKTTNKKLRNNANSDEDINISDLNHALTFNNITGSWAKGTTPMYGNSYYIADPTNNSLGEGYVYPLFDNGHIANLSYGGWEYPKVDITDMKPAIFVRDIMKRIFNKYGYSWQSSFLDSDTFKRLIMPSTNLIITQETAADRSSEVKYNEQPDINRSYRWNGYSAGQFAVSQQLSAGNLTVLSGGQNISSVYHNVAVSGTYNLSAKFGGFKIGFKHYQYNSTPVYYYGLSNFQNLFTIVVNICAYRNGSYVSLANAHIKPYSLMNYGNALVFPASNSDEDSSYAWYKISDFAFLTASNVFLQAGDKLTLTYQYIGHVIAPDGSSLWPNTSVSRLKFVDPTTSNFGQMYNNMVVTNLPGTAVQEFDNIDMNQVLDPNITQSEFIMSITKLFNLYIEQDKTNPNILKIEPRDEYYSNGQILNWTKKVDRNSPITIESPSDFVNKKILLTYTDDVDNHNTTYKKYVSETYGQEVINPETELGSIEIKSNFAPTLLERMPYARTSQFLISSIYETYQSGSNMGQVNEHQFKQRLLYWGGCLSFSNFTDNHGFIITRNNNAVKEVIAHSTSKGWYPYAGHLDNPVNPTLDLNFGKVYHLWETGIGYTENTLYREYYSRILQDYSSINGRLVTCYVKLNANDIYNFSFADTIEIDGVRYYVNRLLDWSPDKLSKIELLKIVNSERLNPTPVTFTQPNIPPIIVRPTDTISGTRPTVLPGVVINPIAENGNVIATDSGLIVGNDNELYSRGTVLIGNNIISRESATDSVVINSRYKEIVSSNITIIGNCLFVDGIPIPLVDIIEGSLNEVQYRYAKIIINLIDGGKDIVRNYRSNSPINIVDGSYPTRRMI